MVDLISDFSQAYDDFGVDAYVNGATEPVKLMFDEDLELDDSGLLAVRSMVTTLVNRKDIVVLKGTTYKVVKVVHYGDQQEENLISLTEV